MFPIRANFFLPFDKLKARSSISSGIRAYIRTLEILHLLSVEEKGFDPDVHLDKMVYVSNHQSLLDILFFLSRFPKAACIVKKSLASFSPYAFLINYASYIKNVKNFLVVEQAVGELKEGNTLIVFPEGTRASKDSEAASGDEYDFQKGAAAIALRAGVGICPVRISYAPLVLRRGRRWYESPGEKCRVVIEYGDPRYFNWNSAEEPLGEASRRVTTWIKSYYLHSDEAMLVEIS